MHVGAVRVVVDGVLSVAVVVAVVVADGVQFVH